jgi:hypothetical protein
MNDPETIQRTDRSDIRFSRSLWIASWLFIPCFWIGLTDGRISETWRGLGFAYAAIFFLGNTFLYFAEPPVQTIKLLPIAAALTLGISLTAVDSHVGGMLYIAMFLSPAVATFSACLNPRYPEYFGPIRDVGMGDIAPAVFDWKTARRISARLAVPIAFLPIISQTIDGSKPRLSLVGFLGHLAFGLAFGFTACMIWFWIAWKVGKRRARGGATSGPEIKQKPDRSDIWLSRFLWIVTWSLAYFFWAGLTDGRASDTWRAVGFAYAAIFLLGSTFLYFAKTPVQTMKLFPFAVVLVMGPLALLSLDSQVGDKLYLATIFSSFLVLNGAWLNPRCPEPT